MVRRQARMADPAGRSRSQLRHFSLRLLTVVIFSPLVAWGFPQGNAHATSEYGSDTSTITIHKFEQPQNYGDPASGSPQEVDGKPIAGVTFEATLVPGIDLGTSFGWEQVQDLTLARALELVDGKPAAAQGTTNSEGVVTLGPLPVGVYLIAEVRAPAGVLVGDPFLITAPLNTPSGLLHDIHVYPKNPVAEITLSVSDRGVVTATDPVRWTSRATVPRVRELLTYSIRHVLPPSFTLAGGVEDVRVYLPWEQRTLDELRSFGTGTGVKAAQQSAYYTVSVEALESECQGCTSLRVEFTEAGRQRLLEAREADPAAAVEVVYRTRMVRAADTADGVYASEAYLDFGASNASSTGEHDATVGSAERLTKYGPLVIQAADRDNPEIPVSGVHFQLFQSAEDARGLTNPIEIAGTDTWVSDVDGTVRVQGLRFSNFVDGAQRDQASPLYRTYYAVMVEVPTGWEGAARPLAARVVSVTEPQTVVQQLWRAGQKPDPEPSPGKPGGETGTLPVTGVRVAGIAVVGVALLAAGVLALQTVRRSPGAGWRGGKR